MQTQHEPLANLKVSMRDGKACEKILKIEVAGPQIQKEYDEFYRAIAPKAKIPGFRPGKAPREILTLHYAKDAHDSVLKHLISESYNQVLHEKSLEPLGQPDISEVRFQDHQLTYQARIEIRPKIKLARTTGLSAKKEKAELKNGEVEEVLGRVQASLVQFKVVEDRPAGLGDFVITDYVCSVEGKEMERRTEDILEIKEDEFLKGFSVQLIGLKSGDEKEIEITFPEKMGRKELAGKRGVFKLKVKEVKARALPPLDDEMARQAGEFSTLDELKENIRRNLLSQKEEEIEVQYEKALLDELLRQNKIDLPEGLVAKRLDYLIHEALHRSGLNAEGDSKLEGQKEELRRQLEPEARRQVHLAFLLDEITLRENIKVEEQDRKEQYERVAEKVHQNAETVRKYYAENEDARRALEDQIRSEKAIEFIKKNAKQEKDK